MEGGSLPAIGTAAAGPRRLIVSIHDVAPSSAPEVAWLRSRLDDLGVARRVLKVIPHERGERWVDADPDLSDALRAEQAAGGEIVLHGWTHLADPTSHPHGRPVSLLDRARAALFAGDAAEFLWLDEPGAAARIAAGRALLESLDLRVEGFCAPGWLAGPGAWRAIRDAGLRYVVSFGRLVDLATDRRWLLPGFGSMGTEDVQESLVGAAGGIVLLARARLPVIRAFLHPQAASTSRPTARALRAIGRLRRERQVATFRDVIAA